MLYLRLKCIGLALLAASGILSPDSASIHCNNLAWRSPLYTCILFLQSHGLDISLLLRFWYPLKLDFRCYDFIQGGVHVKAESRQDGVPRDRRDGERRAGEQ